MRVLDLCCGAGGAAMGLYRAGFTDITGIDLNPQKHYPFRFIQGDALDMDVTGYDLVWLSAPCQRWSLASQCRPGLAETYPDLITPLRQKFLQKGVAYIIENVPGAPLVNPVMLCGSQFDGVWVYRHRIFESNFRLTAPEHFPHNDSTPKAGAKNPISPKGYISVAGHVSPMSYARKAMGIDWMVQRELAEAIPPAYSEFLGLQAMAYLKQALGAADEEVAA